MKPHNLLLVDDLKPGYTKGSKGYVVIGSLTPQYLSTPDYNLVLVLATNKEAVAWHSGIGSLCFHGIRGSFGHEQPLDYS